MTEASNGLLLPFPELAAYREGLQRGEFLVPRCRSCQRMHWYPRAFCPFCYAGDIEPTRADGGGTIYSYTVLGPVTAQKIMAYVTLTEGPRMLASIIDCDAAKLCVDMRVQAYVQNTESGDRSVVFRPTDERSG